MKGSGLNFYISFQTTNVLNKVIVRNSLTFSHVQRIPIVAYYSDEGGF